MIKTIIIDVDGVLTDGKVWFNEKGERTKGFHSRDTEAIRELISLGYSVHLLTSSGWPGIWQYAERTGAIVTHERNKLDWVLSNIKGSYIAIGDSSLDVDFMSEAYQAYCPLDAMDCVKDIPGIRVLKCRGGEGVVAELVTILAREKKEVRSY